MHGQGQSTCAPSGSRPPQLSLPALVTLLCLLELAPSQPTTVQCRTPLAATTTCHCCTPATQASLSAGPARFLGLTLCEAAVDNHAVRSSRGLLLHPVQGRAVRSMQRGAALRQQQVWEVAVEEDAGGGEQAQQWHHSRHLVGDDHIVLLSPPPAQPGDVDCHQGTADVGAQRVCTASKGARKPAARDSDGEGAAHRLLKAALGIMEGCVDVDLNTSGAQCRRTGGWEQVGKCAGCDAGSGHCASRQSAGGERTVPPVPALGAAGGGQNACGSRSAAVKCSPRKLQGSARVHSSSSACSRRTVWPCPASSTAASTIRRSAPAGQHRARCRLSTVHRRCIVHPDRGGVVPLASSQAHRPAPSRGGKRPPAASPISAFPPCRQEEQAIGEQAHFVLRWAKCRAFLLRDAKQHIGRRQAAIGCT